MLIVDFPDRATFLQPEQRAFIIARVNADRGDAEADHFTLKVGLKHAADLKLWAFGLIFCFSTMPAYAFSYFLPVILSGGGYSRELSLILSAPPYVAAAIFTFAMAVFSDKRKNRAIFIGLSATVCFTGLFIMAYAGTLGVRYFGSFLAISGAQSNVYVSLFPLTLPSVYTRSDLFPPQCLVPPPSPTKPTTSDLTPSVPSHPPSVSVWEVSIPFLFKPSLSFPCVDWSLPSLPFRCWRNLRLAHLPTSRLPSLHSRSVGYHWLPIRNPHPPHHPLLLLPHAQQASRPWRARIGRFGEIQIHALRVATPWSSNRRIF